MVRPVALDTGSVAQDLVPCQRLADCGSGYREAVQIVAPSFMRTTGYLTRKIHQDVFERESCLSGRTKLLG
jgi:hypothetical protein